MYIDCNVKAQREAVRNAVIMAVGKMKEKNLDTTEIKIEFLEHIDAVIERLEEIVEEQEERIAIMSEGKDEEKIHRLQRELRNCRNELCLKCGLYHRAHEGVCNGCRYRHAGEWSDDIRDGDPG